jgi:hypothetical protein
MESRNPLKKKRPLARGQAERLIFEPSGGVSASKMSPGQIGMDRAGSARVEITPF